MPERTQPGLHRYLFCPICGARLRVEVLDTNYPEIHRLPEHTPEGNAWPGGGIANLCAGTVVTVTLDFDRCSDCGCKISVHPSGKCVRCFASAPAP